MNITVVSNMGGISWGGSEEAWYQLMLRAFDEGHMVNVLAEPGACSNKRLEACTARGGKVREWRRCNVARLEELCQRARPNFTKRRLCCPDVLLVSLGSLPAAAYVPGLISFLCRSEIPAVLFCQFNAEGLPISPEQRRQLQNVLGAVRRVAFCAEENRLLAERQFAVKMDAAVVLANPIREVLESPVPMPESGHEVVWACVARMETQWKAQDLLLQVLASPRWVERPWRLKLYGLGDDLEHVKNVASMYGLNDKVTFEGYVSRVEDMWNSAHAMILPSRGEGTPLAVLEAMMCGRPVLATDVGGNADVIEDGVTGWIADAATPRLLDAALERAWNDRPRWNEMGRRAHIAAKKLAAADPQGSLLKVLIDTAKLD